MFDWRVVRAQPRHRGGSLAASPGTYSGPMAGFGREPGRPPAPSPARRSSSTTAAAPATTDGCEPFAAAPRAASPLVDRGNCNFTVKVKNAQTAGAATADRASTTSPGPATHGRRRPHHHHPVGHGQPGRRQPLKANLPFTVDPRRRHRRPPDRDSDLDAGVIAHEYGHGISNRLTGGPATVSCLNNAEQMGEGWSDWLALNLTAHAGRPRRTARGVGELRDLRAARRRRASARRPTPPTWPSTPPPTASVADVVNTQPVPHGVGYVWATHALGGLLEPGRQARLQPGHLRRLDDGRQQPGAPAGDGRHEAPALPARASSTAANAILLADQALTGGDNQCVIWAGFAKRGLGFSANQGSSTASRWRRRSTCRPTCTIHRVAVPAVDPPALTPRTAGSTVTAIVQPERRSGSWDLRGSPQSGRSIARPRRRSGRCSPRPSRWATGCGTTRDRPVRYPWKTVKAWATAAARWSALHGRREPGRLLQLQAVAA